MTSPVKNHNKGPIGPLDRDEPCPLDPNLRWYHRLTIADAYRALHSMGVELKDQEIGRAIAEGTGPRHTVVGQRIVDWGEILNWASRTFPKEKLTRKEAVEYIFTVSAVP